MLEQTFSMIRRDWTTFAAFVFVLTAVGVVDDLELLTRVTSAELFVALWITYYVQRSILFNVPMNQMTPGKISNFLLYALKSVFIIGLSFIFTVLIGFSLLSFVAEVDKFVTLSLGVLLFLLVVHPLIYTLLGTWLPAHLSGEEKGLGAALRRGRKSFLAVFAKYVGLGLIPIATLVLVTVYVGSSLFAGGEMVDDYPLLAVNVAVNLVKSSLDVLAISLPAVLMVQRYQADREAATVDADVFA